MTSIQSNTRVFSLTPTVEPKPTTKPQPDVASEQVSATEPLGSDPTDQVTLKGETPEQTSQPVLPEDPEPELRQIQRLDGQATATNTSTFVRLDRQALLRQLGDSLNRLSADGVQRATSLHLEHRDLASGILSSRATNQTPSPQPLTVTALHTQLSSFLEKPDQASKTFASLEAALEAANQGNRGAEAVVEVLGENGEKQYALLELSRKADMSVLKQALESLGVKTYLTNAQGIVSVVTPANESIQARFERVQELYQVAQADKARGFDLNRTGTQEADRTPAYKANVLTVQDELIQTSELLKDQKSKLEAELHNLKSQGQGDSTRAQALASRQQTMSEQLLELNTAQTIVEARLSQLPKSETPIPGSALKVGSDRSHPERIQARLQKAVDILESQLLLTTDPTVRTQIEAQKKELFQEMEGVSRRGLNIQGAELSYRIRMGSMATISKGLDEAQSTLKLDIIKLRELEQSLPTLQGADLMATQAKVDALKQKIQKDRHALVDLMKAEISTYKQHANMRQTGPQKIVELLNLQVAKLDAFDREANPELFLSAVEETQKVLLEDITAAAAKFVGIRPSEAKAMGQITEKTDQYIVDYKVASQKIEGLRTELSRKEKLWESPPVSAVGKQQLSAMEKVYLKKVQDKLKSAPEGSKLEQLKNLYIALEMSKSTDINQQLRARIQVDKIQAKIQELSQDPEVQKAFQDARNEAIKEVFGQHDAVNELAGHILSDEFQEYLSMLPRDQQAEVLQAELRKLNFLNPAKAEEVQGKLLSRQLVAGSGDILKNTSLQDRKDAFATVFGAINDPNTLADKSAKVADGFANAFDALKPEEMDKMRLWMSTMNKDASASAKLYELLASKMPANSPALGELKNIHASGKLGAFMTVVAAVSTTGKLPDTLAKGDFKSVADLSSSAMSVAGGAAGLFDTEKMILAAHNLHLEAGVKEIAAAGRLASAGKFLKVVEVLGPIGDVLGAGLDAYGSYKDFEAGDSVGGWSKAVGAGAGLTGAGAGVLILAGSTGPGAPLVLAGATIIGLAAWGFDAAFGESDEETFLRQLGVLKPGPTMMEAHAEVMRANPDLYRGPKY